VVPAALQFVVTAFRVTRAAMIGTIIAMPLTVFDIKKGYLECAMNASSRP
jgi:hypothetical protein